MTATTPWYVQHSDVGRAYQHFANAVKEKSILDEKTRELLHAALACVFRCPHCTRTHVEAALAAGASKQEVTEAILIAAYEGAGTQMVWRRELFEELLGEEAPESATNSS